MNNSNTENHQSIDNTNTLQIGAFSGYNRRPLPDRNGMTAQIYGENGDDADMISALSLTKFQDADVYVRIHLIKNAVGQIMKNETGFPLISEFKAKIQRPKGLKEGMLAHLFAANGKDSDQVNQMGLSKYLDAFVYVEILKPEAAPALEQKNEDNPYTPEITAEIEEASQHLTPFERKALTKKTKAFHEANRLLKISGFLRQPPVWSKLGTEIDFQTWVNDASCCAAGDSPCQHKASAFKIPAESHLKYCLIPLCSQHTSDANSGNLLGGIPFMKMRRDYLIQEWAWEKILEVVGTPSGIDEPDPQKLFSWASEHGLTQHIPSNYLNKFS